MTGSGLWPIVERHERWWRWAAIGLACSAVAAQWIRLAVNPAGDLQNHRLFAMRLLHGLDLYQPGGLNTPYPPFWAVAHIPATWFPASMMPAAMFPLGVAAIVALMLIVGRMAHDVWPVDSGLRFWVAAGALGLTSRFVLRDLVDAGQNTIVVAVTWAGLWAWTRHQPKLGGLLVGLAAALKLTPLSFLAYFALKRDWRMAGYTAAAALVLSLTPMAWTGPSGFARDVGTWTRGVTMELKPADPSRGILGPDDPRNQALRPALARVLASTGTPFSPSGTIWLIRALMIAFASAVAWSLRHPLGSPRNPRVVKECAAVALLALLVSPIMWLSHAVAILPACYVLLARHAASGESSAMARLSIGTLIVTSLLLNHAFLGDALSELELSASLFTWSFVLLLIATLSVSGRRAARAGQAALVIETL